MIRKDFHRFTFGALLALTGLSAGLCARAIAQSTDGPTPAGTVIGTSVTATYQPDTEGVTFTAASPSASITVLATTALFSLYYPAADEYLYTESAFVHDYLAQSGVWNDGGVLGYAPLTTANTGVDATTPVDELYNFQNGALFLASDPVELAYDVSQSGSMDLGPLFFVFTAPMDGRLPLYRLFSATGPDGSRYFCTTSQATHDSLVASGGWADAGILGYLNANP